ncbi:12241_t:CDS:2, partial [Acaulospora morrowiae]
MSKANQQKHPLTLQTSPPDKIDPSPKTVNKLTDQPDPRTTTNQKHQPNKTPNQSEPSCHTENGQPEMPNITTNQLHPLEQDLHKDNQS